MNRLMSHNQTIKPQQWLFENTIPDSEPQHPSTTQTQLPTELAADAARAEVFTTPLNQRHATLCLRCSAC